MRWFRFAMLILIATILQAGTIKIFAVSNLHIKPDLLLILLVFFSIYCNTTEAIITSFAIGFGADIIGLTMGPQIISFGFFGTLLSYLNRIITVRKMPYQAVTIFATSFAAGVLSILLTSLKGLDGVPNRFSILLGTSVYSSLVGSFLFLPFAWWMQIKTNRFTRNRQGKHA